jgi:hypothetical protein
MNWRRGSGRSAPEGPDGRRRGSGRHALISQSGLGDQPGAFRPRDEQRLGPLVDGDTSDLRHATACRQAGTTPPARSPAPAHPGGKTPPPARRSRRPRSPRAAARSQGSCLPAWQIPRRARDGRATASGGDISLVTGVRPGRCGIVTTATEPPGGCRRHTGMLNTRSLNRGSARTGRTRFGVAGLAIGGVMLAGGMLLAGCSGSSASSSGTAAGSAVVAAPTAAAAAPGIGALPSGAARSASGPSANAGTTAQLAPAGDIIYTAQLTVRAASVGSAAARAAQITEGVGGYVSNETTSADPDHPSEATASVQLKIPVASYRLRWASSRAAWALSCRCSSRPRTSPSR